MTAKDNYGNLAPASAMHVSRRGSLVLDGRADVY